MKIDVPALIRAALQLAQGKRITNAPSGTTIAMDAIVALAEDEILKPPEYPDFDDALPEPQLRPLDGSP